MPKLKRSEVQRRDPPPRSVIRSLRARLLDELAVPEASREDHARGLRPIGARPHNDATHD